MKNKNKIHIHLVNYILNFLFVHILMLYFWRIFHIDILKNAPIFIYRQHWHKAPTDLIQGFWVSLLMVQRATHVQCVYVIFVKRLHQIVFYKNDFDKRLLLHPKGLWFGAGVSMSQPFQEGVLHFEYLLRERGHISNVLMPFMQNIILDSELKQTEMSIKIESIQQ
jgi:hypothetical protein